MRQWRAKNLERARELARKTRIKNYLRLKEQRRIHREELRQKLFDILGKKCARCGFVDNRALQFDHINGGGLVDKMKVGDGEKFYRYYRDHPDEAKQKLQVLCANCNWIKKHMRGENVKSMLILINN